MPFYVGDWLKSQDIQTLPYDLRGIWFEMLCYMWESSERGYLVDNSGKFYSENELAFLLRLPADLLKQKLEILEQKGIFSKRKSDGAIYSRRMVNDEEIRKIRAKVGKKGGDTTSAIFAKAKPQAKVEQKDEIENESEYIDTNRDKEERIRVKKEGFKETLKPYKKIYGVEMLKAFYDYWTEPNKSKTKIKWEMQNTWDVKLRLSNWASRNEKFNKPQVQDNVLSAPAPSNIEE